jgi:hypothetical protein
MTRPLALDAPAEAAATPKKVATFPDSPDPDVSQALATLAVDPSANAALVMSGYCKDLGIRAVDLNALTEALGQATSAMWAGDMKHAEAMLLAQAHALQAMFMKLSVRASEQELIKHGEPYLRMALKAQNQCRMTLETLGALKKPPVVVAQQTNINHGGQQQVNIGTAPAGRPGLARAAKGESAPNELLEQRDDKWLDPGAQSATGGADPLLAAVGEGDRTPDARRQGAGVSQPLSRGASDSRQEAGHGAADCASGAK